MTRFRPGSVSPKLVRNSARSASGSCASSASIAAEMTTTSAPCSAASLRTASTSGLHLGRVLGHVGDVHHGLGRDQVQLLQDVGLALGQHDGARRLAVLERRQQHLQGVAARDGRLVVGLRRLLRSLMDLLHRVQVREHELGVDDLDVVQRIDLARDVHDVVVHEAAHEVRDRMRLANVREELVAQPLALRCALDEARDVDELDDGRHDLLRLHDLRERVELRVRHGDDADVRIDRAERIVLGRNLRRRERVEQRRLTDVRQSDDAALDTHELFGLRLACVQAILGALGALLEHDGQKVGGFAQLVAQRRFFFAAGALEHVVDDFLAAAGVCSWSRGWPTPKRRRQNFVPMCSMTLLMPLCPALLPSNRSCARPGGRSSSS